MCPSNMPQAVAISRRHMIPERMDVGVVLDPIVAEVDAEDIATTLMNRCAPWSGGGKELI